MMPARPRPWAITTLGWSDAELDLLLADPDVRAAAEDVLLEGFDERDAFRPARVHAACIRRYRRPEPARLLFDLAYRVIQTAGTEARQ